MYNFNDFTDKKANRQETMTALRNAKAAYRAAKKEMEAAKDEASAALLDILMDGQSQNGKSYMTTTEVRAATGLDSKTIRSMLCPTDYWSDSRMITHHGTTIGRVTRGKTREYRKFVMLNPDGTINPDITMGQNVRVNTYTAQQYR